MTAPPPAPVTHSPGCCTTAAALALLDDYDTAVDDSLRGREALDRDDWCRRLSGALRTILGAVPAAAPDICALLADGLEDGASLRGALGSDGDVAVAGVYRAMAGALRREVKGSARGEAA